MNNHQKEQERIWKWEEETHIPKEVMAIVEAVAEKIGIDPIYEDTISLYNRGGCLYALAKGFTFCECTSSLEDGPSGPDSTMVKTFVKWIKSLGFEFERSRGDNGMDSATNWHDTFMYHEVIYTPSLFYIDE